MSESGTAHVTKPIRLGGCVFLFVLAYCGWNLILLNQLRTEIVEVNQNLKTLIATVQNLESAQATQGNAESNKE